MMRGHWAERAFEPVWLMSFARPKSVARRWPLAGLSSRRVYEGQPTLRGEGPPSHWLAWVSLLIAASFFWTSCGTPSAPSRPPFNEEDKADIVIRFYSDQVSRILKPKQMEGAFLTSFEFKQVLELAKQQPGRELAVVILIFFNADDEVKLKWLDSLHGLGYRRVVFLRAENGMQINGLTILDDPKPPAGPAK